MQSLVFDSFAMQFTVSTTNKFSEAVLWNLFVLFHSLSVLDNGISTLKHSPVSQSYLFIYLFCVFEWCLLRKKLCINITWLQNVRIHNHYPHHWLADAVTGLSPFWRHCPARRSQSRPRFQKWDYIQLWHMANKRCDDYDKSHDHVVCSNKLALT